MVSFLKEIVTPEFSREMDRGQKLKKSFHVELAESLGWSVSIFLGQQSYKCHSTLNGSIHIFARCEPFHKAGIRPILDGDLMESSLHVIGEHQHSNARSTSDGY